MYRILFRNRWFAAIWALGILWTAYGIATNGIPNTAVPAATPSAPSSEAAFANWALEHEQPAETAVDDSTVTGGEGTQPIELRHASEENIESTELDSTGQNAFID